MLKQLALILACLVCEAGPGRGSFCCALCAAWQTLFLRGRGWALHLGLELPSPQGALLSSAVLRALSPSQTQGLLGKSHAAPSTGQVWPLAKAPGPGGLRAAAPPGAGMCVEVRSVPGLGALSLGGPSSAPTFWGANG